jgi:hypothetical protein
MPCTASQPRGEDKSAITARRADPRQYREEIISLFERNGKKRFRQQFDWYYHEHGQPAPVSWLLWDTDGHVRGLCSVTVRQLRCGEHRICAGVAGNLLVDRNWSAYFGACALVRAAKSLVIRGELDILLGIPNHLARPVFERLHFQTIGRWTTHAQVIRSRELLQSRLKAGAGVAAPIADLVGAISRIGTLIGEPRREARQIRTLSAADLARLCPERWPTGSRICLVADAEYIKWRFLREPVQPAEVVGISTPNERVCALIAVRRSAGRSWIVDCLTDEDELSQMEAILCYLRGRGRADGTVWVAALGGAPLSRNLWRHGFLPVPRSMGGYPDFPLVGFWRPDHPLASVFTEPTQWQLWPGFNDV